MVSNLQWYWTHALSEGSPLSKITTLITLPSPAQAKYENLGLKLRDWYVHHLPT